MHVPSEPQLPTTRTWNFDKLDEKFCRSTAEDHRLYEFYGRAENSKHPNERTNSASYVNWSNEVQVQPSSSVHGRGDTILLRQ